MYYSRTGTTAMAADEIAKRLGCETERLTEGRSRAGPIGYMMAGRETVNGAVAELEPLRHDPSRYDLVVIGTPVWVYRTSVPVRTFLAQNAGRLGRVAFFATYGSSGPERTMEAMTALAGKAPVATLGLTTAEVRKGRAGDKYDGFVAKLGR